MKLTKDQIQFIDTYLINTNILYIDIRYEMMDHIATAVEEKMEAENLDFHDAFKNYMVANKSELMNNNKSSKFFSWNEVIRFLKYLINPIMLLIAALLFISSQYFDIKSYFSETFTFSNLVSVIFIFIMLSQLGYHYLFVKKK